MPQETPLPPESESAKCYLLSIIFLFLQADYIFIIL